LGNPPKRQYSELPKPTSNLLILINPYACGGVAISNWTKMKPMLEKFNLEFTEKQTEYAGHARDFTAEVALDKYTGIVTISGDGLIHEVVNGLMGRAEDPATFPTVGFLPGGTSDGMVKTVLSEEGEGFSLENAVYAVGKGNTKKIDITKLHCESTGKTIYSFLSITWAIIADIDLESEILRVLGDARLYIWAVLRVLFVRTYSCNYTIGNGDKQIESEGNRNVFYLTIHNTSHIHRDMNILPI